jgi:hypothetical protein
MAKHPRQLILVARPPVHESWFCEYNIWPYSALLKSLFSFETNPNKQTVDSVLHGTDDDRWDTSKCFGDRNRPLINSKTEPILKRSKHCVSVAKSLHNNPKYCSNIQVLGKLCALVCFATTNFTSVYKQRALAPIRTVLFVVCYAPCKPNPNENSGHLAEHGVFTNLSKAIDFNSNNNHVSFHNRL